MVFVLFRFLLMIPLSLRKAAEASSETLSERPSLASSKREQCQQAWSMPHFSLEAPFGVYLHGGLTLANTVSTSTHKTESQDI